MPDIIVIGDINIDVMLSIPQYPIPGSETVATSVQLHTGGSAVNTAIALAKMDMEVGFIGRIGQDALAHKILDDLQDAGVDCTHVQVDPKVNTGMVFITVTADGERTMFSARGANVFTDAHAINPQYFTNCRWIHLSGYSFLSYHQYQTMMTALDLAENFPNTRVSLDVGTEPATHATAQILALLPRLDVIFPNEIELSLLSQGRAVNEALDYLLDDQKAHAVVAKRGSQGSILGVGNTRLSLPAIRIEVKDTTGAGDSFNAGVVLGRLVGLSWGASVALGNVLGGLATSEEGAAAHSINKKAVVRLLEKHLFYEEWHPHRASLEELSMYFEGML